MSKPKIVLFTGHSMSTKNANQFEEWDLLYPIVQHVEGDLLSAGVDANPIVDGQPSGRFYELDNDDALYAKIDYVNEVKPLAAIEVHLNRGGGNYGLMLHYPYRKVQGQAVGEGADLARALAYIGEAGYDNHIKVEDTKWLNRELIFIHKTTCPAVITELDFLDGPNAAWLKTEPFAIQHASILTLGIISWLKDEGHLE
jgi:N-acetylmuramoyl-L-alanine amidase